MPYDFSDQFAPTALSASITSTDTVIQVDTLESDFVDAVENDPAPQFPLRIGRDTGAERVLVTGIDDAANNKLTVERGVDSFAAASHNSGARVAHTLPAWQAQEADEAHLAQAELENEIQVLRSVLNRFQRKSVTKSGDGSQKTFTFSHDLDSAPTAAAIQAEVSDAAGEFWISDKRATEVDVTYQNAPASGTDNLTWSLIFVE